MTTQDRHPLGVKARDRVSGWEGTITARCEYLNGCCRYELSGLDKDGAPTGFVFDGQQLEIVDAEHLSELARHDSAKPQVAQPRTGGPRSNRPVDR